ncbi:hypothetical protein SAMN05421863_1004110 [Nitrosomonas communis]|uniref:Uncharacterized protein n=1 Tax=Nitrosomonas communis TaxID=44574 RepID=A0A1I4KKU1_9PROT|nr:hypothetical protein SAMN05421863_1004110 [Nitrosomonas communis]
MMKRFMECSDFDGYTIAVIFCAIDDFLKGLETW